MPAYTVAQLQDILGTGEYSYFAPSGSFLSAMRQVYPRLVSMGLWRDMAYEVSLSGQYGYISLPSDTDAVLACTINDLPRNTRSQWHDIRLTGRQPTMSAYYGIVDDGFHPVLLDMKDVQGVTDSGDVAVVMQLDAFIHGTTTGVPASGYAGTISIAGRTATGQASALSQASSGDLRFTTSGVVAASATLDPLGANNSILFTANTAGLAGNNLTISIATPATQATTAVAVVGEAITVTPGTKARMVVTGTLTRDGTTPVVTGEMLNYDHLEQGKPSYFDFDGSFINISWSNADSMWVIYSPFIGGASWVSSEPVATPDLVVTWTPVSPATGTPTVTADISSAAQVIAAVNAYGPAADLVTASAVGTVTGAVAAVSSTALAGGLDSLGVTSIHSITYDDVPSDIDLVDPNFPTKVLATLPAGSGVYRVRRFRTSNKQPDSTIHLLVARGAPSNLTASTVIYLGNLGAIKHGLLGLISEDNADLERANFHWGMAGKLLDAGLASMFGAAKPTLRIHDPAAGNIHNYF